MKSVKKKKKVSQKLPITPRSRFVQALRLLWLRSRERAFVLKRDKHTCQCCQKKAYKKTKGGKTIEEFKVVVHHRRGIDWYGIVDLIRERILQTPEDLVTLCESCHSKEEGHENYWMT